MPTMKKRSRIVKKPSLPLLTFLGFQINAAIEQGYGEKVTFTNIYKGIEWGTLMDDLDRDYRRSSTSVYSEWDWINKKVS
jgi:hypothetical protein